MNYRYGHLDSNGKLVYAHNNVKVNGITYINPDASIYLQLSPPEKLIVDEAPSEAAPEGKHYEPSGWNETSTELHRVYVLVDDPQPEPQPEPPPPAPRKFSKLYLELALFNMGLLEQVDEFIDSQSITNQLGQTMPLRRLYDKALVFSEDNEYFSEYLDIVKEELGLTDEQVAAVLQQCIAEE